MKKLIAFLLSLFLIFSLVACGPDNTPDDDGDDNGDKPDGGAGDKIDYGPDEDPAAPDFDWELPT